MRERHLRQIKQEARHRAGIACEDGVNVGRVHDAVPVMGKARGGLPKVSPGAVDGGCVDRIAYREEGDDPLMDLP